MGYRVLIRAFTIIEMLVVIAIVAVLAAILVPLVSRARDRARLTQCLTNMRHISAALMTYTADHNETYPLARMRAADGCDPRMEHWTWKRAVQAYVKSNETFQCPSVKNLWAACPDTPGAFGDESNIRGEILRFPSRANWLPASYAYSDGFFRGRMVNGCLQPRLTSELKDPAGTLLLLNTRTGAPAVGPSMLAESGYSPETGAKDRRYLRRYGVFVAHLRRIPFVLADGHVRSFSSKETVAPLDRWHSEDPDWDGRTETGRRNLQAVADYAETYIDEYR